MVKKILLIGGGGHCKSVLDSLINIDEYTEIGIIDIKENIGKKILNFPIIGCDDDLQLLFAEGFDYAFVSLGSIGDPTSRIRLFKLLKDIGFKIPVIIDPSAIISRYSNIENGSFIGKKAIINTNVSIGKGCIINSGSVIEHDCIIGDFTHIASGAVLGGEVNVGNNCHIGANATIKQLVNVGSNSMIGMGSVVLNNINNDSVAYGNPCREVSKR